MARGITQEQVNSAIEQLLLSGERPTIERVRAALGTGSPNTLTRMLDAWWQALGDRLTAQHRSAAVPDAPVAVVSAASKLWEAALAAGRAHAEAVVAPERAALADALGKMEAAMAKERAATAQADREKQTALESAKGSHAALVISDKRVSDLLRQVAMLEVRVQDLTVRGDELTSRLDLALSNADSERSAAATEREALLAHGRQTEDRAHAEVDRTRQELKVSKAQLVAQARDHATILAGVEEARRAADLARQRAERDCAAAQARLEGLQLQITRSLAPPDKTPARKRQSKAVAKSKVAATRESKD